MSQELEVEGLEASGRECGLPQRHSPTLMLHNRPFSSLKKSHTRVTLSVVAFVAVAGSAEVPVSKVVAAKVFSVKDHHIGLFLFYI